jgi:AcrR family transcriptional regulator
MDTTELPGRRERKKRATRDAIYFAARTLFMKKGFDAVTVAEIAEAADVSEKTVFNHFATKEDLALAGSQERLEKTIEAL